MKILIITGSGGLIGSEAVNFFHKKYDKVIGIDNNQRSKFFGKSASVKSTIDYLKSNYQNYEHFNTDIRDKKSIDKIFNKHGSDIKAIIHTAAQPSHDYAASDVFLDFSVNTLGTLNILDSFKNYSSKAVFIFCSTNKVYGNRPNFYNYNETNSRLSPSSSKLKKFGFDENLSVDQCLHSLFGSSKLSADIYCQEYARYFNLKIGIFRGGCLTGGRHKGVKLHGFLSFLVRSLIEGNEYEIIGHKGKQVRDNIHSYDLINCFNHFINKPREGEVYNIGGGIENNCSIIEAIKIAEQISGKKMKFKFSVNPRIGDHIWWVSDIRKFQSHYPTWKQKFDIHSTIEDIIKHS
tara:strand:- start:925 stop:1971 length:1047 start_codon:yes stop_codon:yes gene_type:complete